MHLLEEGNSVGHFIDFAYLQCLEDVSDMELSTVSRRPHCFVATGCTFGMPSLNIAVDLRTSVENVIEVFLVGRWSGRAVRKGARRQGSQGTRRIVFEERGEIGMS